MIFRFLLLFFIVSACAMSPGFKKEPSSKNPKKMGLEQNGVTLFFHNINKMNLSAMPKIGDIQKNKVAINMYLLSFIYNLKILSAKKACIINEQSIHNPKY